MRATSPILPAAAAIACFFPIVQSAKADSCEYLVTGDAQAVITTDPNSVTLTLTDLAVNPSAVSQNLSAFMFTLNTDPSSVSIASYSDSTAKVTGPGYTTRGNVNPGWVLGLASAVTSLDVLTGSGHAGPAQTIIGLPGSGGYTNANGSIAGNGPHNPFLYGTVTWTLNEAGVTQRPLPGTLTMFAIAGLLLGTVKIALARSNSRH